MGGIVPFFPKNFSRIFFTNTLFKGSPPLFDCQNDIYGGDTEGGRGTYAKTPIWEGVCQDPLVIYKVINNGGRISLVMNMTWCQSSKLGRVLSGAK